MSSPAIRSGRMDVNALNAAEQRLLAEAVDLQLADKLRFIATLRAIEAGDVAGLFNMPAQPKQRELKRAYFELSRLYHPDRFYGKKLGSFRPILDRIFASLSQYVKTLS